MPRFVVCLFFFVISTHLMAQDVDSYIRGVDASFVQQIEEAGGVYRVNGVVKDVLDIFKENGVNYIRLRLWHTPSNGYCGTAKTIQYARKVKSKGFRLLLDFHYSDWWADPKQQTKPAAWATLPFSSLKDSVYAYTKNVVEAFRKEGVLPDMVQIGNEIVDGMLWPEGRISVSGWTQFAELLKAGIQGAKDATADTSLPIMIHIDRGANNSTSVWYYTNLNNQNVPYDIIGLSYYPWWHGSLSAVETNLNDLAVRFGKDIVIVETAYPWTTQWVNDSVNNVGVDVNKLLTGYPATPQGQKSFLFALNKIIKGTSQNRGRGFFYWEPAYISVPGVGSSWEHLTTFDFSGNALPALSAFLNFDTIKAVNVKVRFNASTNPDTLRATGKVQMRGQIKGMGSNFLPNGVLLTSDANSQLQLQNIGGDYWECNFQMYPYDSLLFKFWTGHTSSMYTYWNLGTEGKVLPYDGSALGSRLVVAGSSDTSLPIQYYSNSLVSAVPQYWTPFEHKEDSVGVLFRVNMIDLMVKGLFDPATQGPVVVRGDSFSSAGVLSWNTDKCILTRETIGVGGASFWSTIAYFPKSIPQGTSISYKYFVHSTPFGGWEENIAERSFFFPATDTTLAWQFFNNKIIPTHVEEISSLPLRTQLYSAYPNPFNPATQIRYTLAKRTFVRLVIYNILGQVQKVLVEKEQSAGDYTVTWDARNGTLPSGIYFVCLTANGVVSTKKVLFLK